MSLIPSGLSIEKLVLENTTKIQKQTNKPSSIGSKAEDLVSKAVKKGVEWIEEKVGLTQEEEFKKTNQWEQEIKEVFSQQKDIEDRMKSMKTMIKTPSKEEGVQEIIKQQIQQEEAKQKITQTSKPEIQDELLKAKKEEVKAPPHEEQAKETVKTREEKLKELFETIKVTTEEKTHREEIVEGKKQAPTREDLQFEIQTRMKDKEQVIEDKSKVKGIREELEKLFKQEDRTFTEETEKREKEVQRKTQQTTSQEAKQIKGDETSSQKPAEKRPTTGDTQTGAKEPQAPAGDKPSAPPGDPKAPSTGDKPAGGEAKQGPAGDKPGSGEGGPHAPGDRLYPGEGKDHPHLTPEEREALMAKRKEREMERVTIEEAREKTLYQKKEEEAKQVKQQEETKQLQQHQEEVRQVKQREEKEKKIQEEIKQAKIEEIKTEIREIQTKEEQKRKDVAELIQGTKEQIKEADQRREESKIMEESSERKLDQAGEERKSVTDIEEKVISVITDGAIKLKEIGERENFISYLMERDKGLKGIAEAKLSQAQTVGISSEERGKKLGENLKKISSHHKFLQGLKKRDIEEKQRKAQSARDIAQFYFQRGEESEKTGKNRKLEFDTHREWAKEKNRIATEYEKIAEDHLTASEELIKKGDTFSLKKAEFLKSEAAFLMKLASTNRQEGKELLGRSLYTKDLADRSFKNAQGYMQLGDSFIGESTKDFLAANMQIEANLLESAQISSQIKEIMYEMQKVRESRQESLWEMSDAARWTQQRRGIKNTIKDTLTSSLVKIKEETIQSGIERGRILGAYNKITLGKMAMQEAKLTKKLARFQKESAFRALIASREKFNKAIDTKMIRQTFSINKYGLAELVGGINLETKTTKVADADSSKPLQMEEKREAQEKKWGASAQSFEQKEQLITEYESQLSSTQEQWNKKHYKETEMLSTFKGLDYKDNKFRLMEGESIRVDKLESSFTKLTHHFTQKEIGGISDPEKNLMKVEREFIRSEQKKREITNLLKELEHKKIKDKLTRVEKELLGKETKIDVVAMHANKLPQEISNNEFEQKSKGLKREAKSKSLEGDPERKQALKRFANDIEGLVNYVYGKDN